MSAVIPVKNEKNSIDKVIREISRLPVDLIIPVINGSSDRSLKKLISKRSLPMEIVFSKDALGIDIPRAVGAKLAYDRGSDFVLFVDGDMKGSIFEGLKRLIDAAREKKQDITLTNCYDGSNTEHNPAQLILFFRAKLNEKIEQYDALATCTPSHGPHIISKRLLQHIGFKALAIPPVTLAMAAKLKLEIGIGAEIPHCHLGSGTKNEYHTKMIAKTIIGDCIQAMNVYDGKYPGRIFGGREYIGYHAQRNWQILNTFLQDSSFLEHLKC